MNTEQSLERVSTVEALSRALRRRILDGDLAPAERLPEVELSAAYGVGRYTVRAALQDLVYRGMAEHAPNRGVSVLLPTPEIIRDLYAYRTALECEAARMIVEHGRPVDGVKRALSGLADVPTNAPWRELLEADLAVHRAVVDAAGSPHMSRAFESILDQVMLCLSRLHVPRAGVLSDHQRLLRALSSGDPDRAARTLRDHLREAVEQLGARDTAPSRRASSASRRRDGARSPGQARQTRKA
jgi:DNA-binding GntR family transcriptional regulator